MKKKKKKKYIIKKIRKGAREVVGPVPGTKVHKVKKKYIRKVKHKKDLGED